MTVWREMAINAVRKERDRQDDKWPPTGILRDHDHWLPVLLEELGEVATECLKDDRKGLERELAHVAAVAVAWLEEIQMEALG
jgi:NTP pyrophosphatase (non-canonical NTP hydrolase)